MAMEIKIKELSLNYFVLGENKQVQKVSLKSVTRREIYRESLLNTILVNRVGLCLMLVFGWAHRGST